MLFTSGMFLFAYLPFTLVSFFVLGKFAGIKVAAAWLALMSIVFYGYWAPIYVVLLMVSIAINYGGALLVYRAGGAPRAGFITASAVAADLLLLGYFKYYNFFSDNLRGTALSIPVLNVVLPIGISFFTFTQIAYVVDTYRGKIKEFDPIRYVLFVTYFPHLIAGPIIHHAEMMPQFANPQNYRPRLRNFAIGMAFLLIGMTKKVLIADGMSPIADSAFSAARFGGIDMMHAWEGAVAYTMQLYFDFSGYSDMAIGISLLIGMKLPYNFNSPYKSRSIIEFWRRWHLTLSRFLRDYLYIGLGGNRKGHLRRYFNLFATMVLGGLWHGAAWTFVIWGALHGAYLVVNHAWDWMMARLKPGGMGLKLGAGAQLASWLLTMLAVVIGWVFFRAASVDEALRMLSVMAGFGAQTGTLASVPIHWIPLLLLTAFAALAPNSQSVVTSWFEPMIDGLLAHRFTAGAVASLFGASCVLTGWLALIVASRANSAFIYFNF